MLDEEKLLYENITSAERNSSDFDLSNKRKASASLKLEINFQLRESINFGYTVEDISSPLSIVSANKLAHDFDGLSPSIEDKAVHRMLDKVLRNILKILKLCFKIIGVNVETKVKIKLNFKTY